MRVFAWKMLKRACINQIGSLALIGLGAVLMGTPAWGSISFCPTMATPLNPTYTPPADPNVGCSVGNLSFSNFSVGTDAGSTINGVVLGANSSGLTIPDWSAGEGPTIAAAPGGYGIELAADPTNAPKVGFCASNSGSQGWCINGASLSLASSVTYQMNALNGTTFDFVAMSATIGLHTNGSGSGATSVVFREVCPGTTTFSQNCVGYQVIQIGALNFNGSFNGGNTFETGTGSVTFSPTTMAAIRDTVYLVTPNGNGSWAAIGSFDFLAPEPATFSMMFGGFAGLGLLAWRRKRKAQS